MSAILKEIDEFFPTSSIKIMNQEECEEILKEESRGAYLFRKERSGDIYLSGIEPGGELHHAKIIKEETQWKGLNGGMYQAEHLKKLVCLCLHCDQKEIYLLK